MVEVLERVLASSPSPASIRLEATTDIRSTVESFYQSDCGMEYIQILKEHRTSYVTRMSSVSLPTIQGSVMTNSPQFPQIHTNSIADTNDIESQNPIQHHQQQRQHSLNSETVSPSPRSSESSNSQSSNNNNLNANPLKRITLYDIIDLMSESPNYSLLEHLAHTSKHSKLSTELEYVYKQIEENSVWKVIDELSDPVLILSGKDPFLILKSSMSWLSMMGCKSSQVFGKLFEHFVYFPDPQEETRESSSRVPITQTFTTTTTTTASSPISDPNHMTFQEVTTTLEAFYNNLNLAHPNSHIHCVLPLQHCSTHTKIKCSIHAFPIYKRLSEDDTSINDKPRYFLQRSNRDSVSNQPQNHSSVAFYILYINNFVVQYDTTLLPVPLVSTDGGESIPPSVSTTEMSPISSLISNTSITTNLTENLRKQGLANDL